MLKLFVVLLASFGICLSQELERCSEGNRTNCRCEGDSTCGPYEICMLNSEGNKCKKIYKYCSDRNGNEPCICGDDSNLCNKNENCEGSICKSIHKRCYGHNVWPCLCGDHVCRLDEHCETRLLGDINKCKKKSCSEKNSYPCRCMGDSYCQTYEICEVNSEGNKCIMQKFCSLNNEYPCICVNNQVCGQLETCEVNPQGNKCISAIAGAQEIHKMESS